MSSVFLWVCILCIKSSQWTYVDIFLYTLERVEPMCLIYSKIIIQMEEEKEEEEENQRWWSIPLLKHVYMCR